MNVGVLIIFAASYLAYLLSKQLTWNGCSCEEGVAFCSGYNNIISYCFAYYKMVEVITVMREAQSAEKSVSVGDCVNIKIEDEELKKECAAASEVVNNDTTTIAPLVESDTSQFGEDSSSSSQVKIPSAVVKAEVSSSSDDSNSMPPPPAVVRAALPSTASLNVTSAISSVGRVPPAPPAKTTSSPTKQQIKQVPAAPHPAPASSITRPGNMAPPNPVARTAGLIGRPPAQQPNTTAAIAAMKAAKLIAYPNPVISSSAVPKPSPALATSHADGAAQSSASQYETDITTASDNVSVTSNTSSSSKKKAPHPLRRGKWTSEEEAYANRLICEFKSGLLPLTDGTTLRNFLSKLLNCDPMRISKKFVGNNCIGKQVFRRRVADINRITTDQMQQTKMELSELESRFLDRVAQTNRVKAPGVSAAIGPNGVLGPLPLNMMNVGGARGLDDLELDTPPTPPWLRPPTKYKPTGKFAERLEAKAKAVAERKAKLAAAAAAIAAAAAAAATQASNLVKNPEVLKASVSPLDQLARTASSEAISRTESALEQLARTASGEFKFVLEILCCIPLMPFLNA